MSKVSAKSRYTQLMEWLRTYPPSPKYKDKDSKNSRKQSRMTYYKKKGFNR